MSRAESLLGRVTQGLPEGGEDRPGQRNMAAAVDAAIETQSTAMVEAGTGTGKSLAYLTPIVAAEKRAVIATATIALQGQLIDHDIPLVAEHCDRPIQAALLKGRGNYLCRQRFDELTRADHTQQLDLLRGTAPGFHLEQIRDWANRTETGDREELDPSPPSDVWSAVSVGADECPGASRCPSGERCFAEMARSAAMDADVIVTNHHYYGLDVAAGGALLPEHDVVVFDEAHHLPEVIGATCGSDLSGGRFRALARRVRHVLTDEELPLALDRSAGDLEALLRPERGSTIEMGVELVEVLVDGRTKIEQVVAALRKVDPPSESDAAARVERAQTSATALIEAVDALIESDDDDVVWVDGGDTNPVLRRTPLDVGEILDESLWGHRTAVLTSATLPEALGEQLGLSDEHEVLRVGSPFAFEDLGLLYCAAHLPDPRHPDARAAVRAELVELATAAGGRTLGLFTSYSAMRDAAEELSDVLDLPVLVQGEKPKPVLIEEFKQDPRAVLLATMSFWQGVDLPGDTLTLVTVDRLPFPRPDEPVTQARRDRAGPAAFRTVDLPRAQMLLAQAAGRLVRRADDRGVVAILDTRLATNRSYRWDLINALPPFRRTKEREEVLAFLRQLDAEASTDGTEPPSPDAVNDSAGS